MRARAGKARWVGIVAMAFAMALPAAASASPVNPTGVIKLAPPEQARIHASQSGNWFGYNAGTLQPGGALFNSISASWTVPTVSRHPAGQAGDSSTWIGIGGGCVSSGCGLTDDTLIQAGTEQDVDSAGNPSYYAWWELVPAPAVSIGNLSVSPGDRIHASISELVPDSEVWTITVSDTTKGESFSTTVPYSSTHTTAEWIEETPLAFGTGGVGEATLPNLTTTQFTNANLNGSPANLTSGKEVDLVQGSVIGAPSAPFSGGTAFNDCAWASSCPVPSAAAPAPSPRSATKATHASRHKKKHKRKRRRRARHKRRRR